MIPSWQEFRKISEEVIIQIAHRRLVIRLILKQIACLYKLGHWLQKHHKKISNTSLPNALAASRKTILQHWAIFLVRWSNKYTFLNWKIKMDLLCCISVLLRISWNVSTESLSPQMSILMQIPQLKTGLTNKPQRINSRLCTMQAIAGTLRWWKYSWTLEQTFISKTCMAWMCYILPHRAILLSRFTISINLKECLWVAKIAGEVHLCTGHASRTQSWVWSISSHGWKSKR